jgi:UDP-glucuronate 4-epimerase
VGRALDEHEITRFVHLAALQVPFCRAEPVVGARVNVVGTVTSFEAVKARRDRISGLVYASSTFRSVDRPTTRRRG